MLKGRHKLYTVAVCKLYFKPLTGFGLNLSKDLQAEEKNKMNNQSIRVEPSLLNRLTDKYVEAKIETYENRTETIEEYKNSIKKDLERLFNSHNTLGISEEVHSKKDDEIYSSILTYGMKSLAGTLLTTPVIESIKNDISESVLKFEPRIIPESLEVEVRKSQASKSAEPNKAEIRISGSVYTPSSKETFAVRTEIDVETGRYSGLSFINE